MDLQWQGVADDPNGVGLLQYSISRNGAYVGASITPQFSDTAVSPSTAYSYQVCPLDQHNNTSSCASIAVTTPPAGTVETRRVGIRSTGSYWGGAGEQIDMFSGNLNYTLPLFRAQARGGWGVTFALHYNSQFWFRDAQRIWRWGDGDRGYGHNWRLQAGSLTPLLDEHMGNSSLHLRRRDRRGVPPGCTSRRHVGVQPGRLRELQPSHRPPVLSRRQFLVDGGCFERQ